jgi:hypothetical protein
MVNEKKPDPSKTVDQASKTATTPSTSKDAKEPADASKDPKQAAAKPVEEVEDLVIIIYIIKLFSFCLINYLLKKNTSNF